VAWGFINALYFLPLLILNKNRKNVDDFKLNFNLLSVKIVFNILITFTITCFAWIFFSAKYWADAWHLSKGVRLELWKTLSDTKVLKMGLTTYDIILLSTALCIWVVVETAQQQGNLRLRLAKYPVIETILALGLLISIILLGTFNNTGQFIYFQF
jgi:hypothetical protein